MALAAYESALAESRVEFAVSQTRVARLKLASELEKLGRHDEASEIIAAVREEQQQEEPIS
jgi:hypothetical protein